MLCRELYVASLFRASFVNVRNFANLPGRKCQNFFLIFCCLISAPYFIKKLPLESEISEGESVKMTCKIGEGASKESISLETKG